MNFEIEKIEPYKTPEWIKFISIHSDSMVYHHPAWLKAISACSSKVEDMHLMLKSETGEIMGILPGITKINILGKRIFQSLPFTSYVSPLFLEQNQTDLFLRFLKNEKYQKNIDNIEIRFLNNHFLSPDVLGKCQKNFVTQFLPLPEDCSSIWKKLHTTSVRQRILKAKRMPYELEIRTDKRSLEIFYHLHILSRRRIGLPPLPEKFFVNLWRFLTAANLMKILILKLSGKFASAMILLSYKKYAHAEYTATDPRYLKFNANHLITWRAIEIAANEGCRTFDFGRTEIHNKGLLDYKRRWGTTQVPLFYYQDFVKHPIKYFNNYHYIKKIRQVCKHLPIPVLKLISNIYGRINY